MPAPVTTLDDAMERLKPKAEDLKALGVERLALFGSVLRGRPRSGMSFEPADFIRHIVAEADYLLEASEGVDATTFA